MEPATEDQIAAIDHTHEHWSEFDIAYEGYRWHLLHAVVAEAHFDQAKAEALVTELEGGAKSYGYGREDSYRARMSRADVGTDEIESLREDLDNLQDNDPYLSAIGRSINRLMAVACTNEGRSYVGELFSSEEHTAE